MLKTGLKMLRHVVLISTSHCIAEMIYTQCQEIYLSPIYYQKNFLLTKLFQEKQQLGVPDF